MPKFKVGDIVEFPSRAGLGTAIITFTVHKIIRYGPLPKTGVYVGSLLGSYIRCEFIDEVGTLIGKDTSLDLFLALSAEDLEEYAKV